MTHAQAQALFAMHRELKTEVETLRQRSGVKRREIEQRFEALEEALEEIGDQHLEEDMLNLEVIANLAEENDKLRGDLKSSQEHVKMLQNDNYQDLLRTTEIEYQRGTRVCTSNRGYITPF